MSTRWGHRLLLLLLIPWGDTIIITSIVEGGRDWRKRSISRSVSGQRIHMNSRSVTIGCILISTATEI